MVHACAYIDVVALIAICNSQHFENKVNLKAVKTARRPSLPANYLQNVMANLQQQCDRCRFCDFGSYPSGVHPCESFICKNSAMMSASICSGCKDYTHCNTSCKGECFLLPLLNQVPTRKKNYW